MFKIISNFFKKTIAAINKNKKALVFLIIGLLLVLTPTRSVNAVDMWYDDIVEGWDNLLKAVTDTPGKIANIPFNVAILSVTVFTLFGWLATALVVSLIYFIIVATAHWIIVYALTVGVSPGGMAGTPEIITTGWNFTSGFVNMFFILTLTFIGLATILRLKEYEAKQLLPKILLIAVLVNFTPVIIGFIVDMGNLTTKFFVDKTSFTTGGKFIDRLNDIFGLDTIGDYMTDNVKDIAEKFDDTLIDSINIITSLVISIIYACGAGYVYLLITGMFFLRIIMLWVLTILSPIAFFSYVFPSGSTFRMLFPDILSWERWWEEFLKWVIVGIPFGLFLYISQSMQGVISSGGLEISTGSELTSLLNPVTNILANLASLMMLHVGYKISLNAAPAMAKSMIESTDKALKAVAKTIATAGVGAVAGAGAGAMGSMAGNLGAKGASMAAKGGIKGMIGKGMGGMSKVMRKGQTRLTQTAIKNKPKIIENFGDMNMGQKENALEGMGKRTKLAHMEKMNLNEMSEDGRKKLLPEVEEMMQNKTLMGQYKGTFKNFSNSGTTSEKITMGLSKNPEDTKKSIDDNIQELQEMIDSNPTFKLKIESQIANKTPKEAEQFKRDFGAQMLSYDKLDSTKIKTLGKKEVLSLPFRLASRKFIPSKLESVKNNHEDEANEVFNGMGGINSMELKNPMMKPEMRRHLLNSPKGKTWGWKAGANLNEKYKNKKGNADMEKIDAFMTAVSPNTPKGVYINPNEIATRRQSVIADAVTAQRYSEEFKATAIQAGSPEEVKFRNDWILAEAKRQLIKEKAGVGKTPLENTDKELLEKTKGSASKARSYNVKRLTKKKKRIEGKSTASRLITSPLMGAADKLRTKILGKRIQLIKQRIDNKAIKGSEEQKLASSTLEEYSLLNENIKILEGTVTNVNKAEEEISKLKEEAVRLNTPLDPDILKGLKDDLIIKQAKYKTKEKEIKDQKAKIKSNVETIKLLNLTKQKKP